MLEGPARRSSLKRGREMLRQRDLERGRRGEVGLWDLEGVIMTGSDMEEMTGVGRGEEELQAQPSDVWEEESTLSFVVILLREGHFEGTLLRNFRPIVGISILGDASDLCVF